MAQVSAQSQVAITGSYDQLDRGLIKGVLAQLVNGNEVQAIHTDHRGAPRLVTDSQAQVVWQADYSPFGEAEVMIAQIDLPHRLPGQQLDSETGLHYNYFRHYDPSTGRYTTSDPLGLLAGYNTYGYVGGNPLSLIDPTGLAEEALVLGVGGVGVLAYVGGAVGGVATFVAGVLTSPVVLAGVVVAGTAVSFVALAVYFNGTNDGNEEVFIEEMGGDTPTAEDFDLLREQALQYNPEFNTLYPPSVSGDSWTDLVWLQTQLLEEQRAYIASCELNDHDHILLNEANEAVTAADAAEEAAKAAEVAAACEAAGNDLKEALYRNKKSPANGETPGDGIQGYFNRMLEQMCGEGGAVFDDHKKPLEETANRVRNKSEEMGRLGCKQSDHLTEEDRRLIVKIKDRDSSWAAKNLPHLGEDHALCIGYREIITEGNYRKILSLISRMTGSGY